jgi:MerR family transcriptional regulator, light-induced transcriptional regulator
LENLYELYRLPIARVANSESELTIAQLAERTGLSAGTLRMWESRHGFPEPARLPGGHRRYSEADAEQVREVMRLRDHGLSLPAAVERVRSRRTPPAVSVFAGLRRRRPDVAATVLPKPAVLALSRAIEDEYCAQAADGVIIGAFQRERFYRHAEHRWRELARTAHLAVALADFAARADPRDGPVEVPIAPRHALSREWAVIIDAEGVRACLAAWEQPCETEVPDALRRFEVLWSFEPSVVSDAMAVTADLLSPIDADVGARLRSTLQSGAGDPDPAAALRYGGAVAHRMVGYLGRMLLAPGGTSRHVRR